MNLKVLCCLYEGNNMFWSFCIHDEATIMSMYKVCYLFLHCVVLICCMSLQCKCGKHHNMCKTHLQSWLNLVSLALWQLYDHQGHTVASM